MARTIEQDCFDAIRANWLADPHRWGRSDAEGVPSVRDVERAGSDKETVEPSVHVRFGQTRRQATAGGTPRWDVVADLVLRMSQDTQYQSDNYGGLRDHIVSRMIQRLDDANLSGVPGASHLLGRAQVLAVVHQEHGAVVRVLCVGEET